MTTIPKMPFWLAFSLALLATVLIGAMGFELIPPGLWTKLGLLGLFVVSWVNTVLGNPIKPAESAPTVQAAPPLPPPPPSIGKAAGWLLPLLAVGTLGLVACPSCDGQQVKTDVKGIAADCVGPELLPLVVKYIPKVVVALLSDNWEALLGDLVAEVRNVETDIADAEAFVACVVQVVDHNSGPPAGAAATPTSQLIRQHAGLYLAKYAAGGAK